MTQFHHGYLLVGNIKAAFKTALNKSAKLLNENEGSLNTNLDFLFLKKDLFTIDDARAIRDSSSKRSFTGSGRVFLIQANFFSKEACNALLKTMEEPIALSWFFIITPFLENVSITLRSRLALLRFPFSRYDWPQEEQEFVKKFLKAPPAERVEILNAVISDKEKALGFLDGLEMILGKKLKQNFSSAEMLFALQEIEVQKKRLFGRSPSLKMILEHLCLVLPNF